MRPQDPKLCYLIIAATKAATNFENLRSELLTLIQVFEVDVLRKRVSSLVMNSSRVWHNRTLLCVYKWLDRWNGTYVGAGWSFMGHKLIHNSVCFFSFLQLCLLCHSCTVAHLYRFPALNQRAFCWAALWHCCTLKEKKEGKIRLSIVWNWLEFSETF